MNEFEKDFDDEVYEDEFYEDNIEEELIDEDEQEIFEDEEDELFEEPEKKIEVSLACEDCDYRWEDVVIKPKDVDLDDIEVVCPMCGSINVTQI